MAAEKKLNTGDPCPKCDGTIVVLNSRPKETYRVWYLGCGWCGYRPEDNKQIVPLEYAPKRSKR
jgi:ssDNA-binding Zn-finger/Zn-ribbon topoisomerase 1